MRIALIDFQMPGIDGYDLAEIIRTRPEFSMTLILMLSSVAGRDRTARAREIGIDACLTKPIRQAALRDALLAVIASHDGGGRTPVFPAQVEAGTRPLCILVAEDNAVNRRVVTALLQKRGHSVETVENGRDAVAAATTGASTSSLWMCRCRRWTAWKPPAPFVRWSCNPGNIRRSSPSLRMR
ncbi:MAG: response regulator [Gemmatimonadaceae bacterium]